MSARLIYGEEERLLPWAEQRIGIAPFRRDAYSIGLARNGELAGVIVFDTFTPNDCQIHVASDGSRTWLTKELLAAAFAYPFIQLEYQSITAIVACDNEQALSFDMALGFEKVGVRHRAGVGGKDIIILEMMRDKCRWIPEEFRA